MDKKLINLGDKVTIIRPGYKYSGITPPQWAQGREGKIVEIGRERAAVDVGDGKPPIRIQLRFLEVVNQ